MFGFTFEQQVKGFSNIVSCINILYVYIYINTPIYMYISYMINYYHRLSYHLYHRLSWI